MNLSLHAEDSFVDLIDLLASFQILDDLSMPIYYIGKITTPLNIVFEAPFIDVCLCFAESSLPCYNVLVLLCEEFKLKYILCSQVFNRRYMAYYTVYSTLVTFYQASCLSNLSLKLNN